MDKRILYTVDDYLKDDDFIIAVLDHDSAKLSQWEEFLRYCPMQEALFNEARGVLQGLPNEQLLSEAEAASLKDSIWKSVLV